MMIMQGDNFIECSNEQSYQWFTHRLVSQPWPILDRCDYDIP